MCTLIVARGMHPDWPVLVAANRDEFLNRPATPPQVLLEAPRAVGGRDLKAGGTWMGVTAAGHFVGLTNQRTFAAADPDRRSRGDVVLEALRLDDPGRVSAWLATLRPDDYNPFNLLYGTADDLRVAYAHPGEARVRIEPVPPGLHVLPNDVLDAPSFPKVDGAMALLAGVPADALFEAMQAALGDTTPPPELPLEPDNAMPAPVRAALHALRVITPIYGTRSATAVALRPGGVARYLFADGAPGVAPFEDLTHLVQHGDPS
jgi:uncharacterized protein with NRDE domain